MVRTETSGRYIQTYKTEKTDLALEVFRQLVECPTQPAEEHDSPLC